MLTAILSLSQLRGAKLWLVFWLALAALYFALMLGVPPLRRKAGAKNILLAFLAAEVFTDLVWAGVYGYHPVCRNYGIAAVYGLALWPVSLAAAAAAALVWGKRNSSKKEKSPMWSEKNSLSLSRLAVLLFTGAVFYLPMVMVAAAAAFMGLIVRIIKNVFQRAIGMKAELDLTI